ncbi:hypothetical protein J421_4780 (plasmid) [Gemmatirosa kalamazoonensis]|uniref:Uncharacterized protein n=1 Tax=Gemmatirosa kalamazoonensis TaxID=861299 RepID=W0RPQ4_9BACT|nr:hypothetical protein [Gemmatirosa kalamazoonensis]AHG92315.1 hypothetical protein J421_4780 [Gemmatirosa kalamazoonensis]
MTSTMTPPATPAAAPARAERRPATPAAWRWYRSEPWLALVLAAYVPMLVAFFTPQRFHLAFMVVSGALMVAALVLLLRQGPFQPRRPSR